MATHCQGLSNSSNGLERENLSVADFPNREFSRVLGLEVAFPDQELVINAHLCEEQRAYLLQKQSLVNEGDDNPNRCGLSTEISRYIDHIRMEENMVNETHMRQDSLDLLAKGRSLYEILENPSTAEFFDPAVGNEPESEQMVSGNSFQEQNVGGTYLLQDQALPSQNDDSHCNCDSRDEIIRYIDQMLMEEDLEDAADTLQESSDFQAKVNSFYELLNQKYPPSPPQESAVPHDQCGSTGLWCQNSEYEENSCPGARGKKKTRQVEANDNEEDKTTKLPSADTEANRYPPEEFDDFWIYTDGGREKKLVDYIKRLQISASERMHEIGVRGRPPLSKKQNTKKEVVDFTSLLIKSAQSVSLGDYRAVNELLWKIREHSSHNGDGTQRLAHYFANGLEARQAGIGSQIYKSLLCETKSPSEYLKLYFLSFVSSSFIKISTLISNKLITVRSEKARKIHIIDFGIFYGFQWPAFIRQLAKREGGPPELRITGVDSPQPGPWPMELAEETGGRLAMYGKMFEVPFKYDSITRAWGSVRIEDLKIEKGEFVVVNCLYKSKILLSEEHGEECPRSMFLDLVRRINPDVFVHGVVNGDYSEPFFVPRFRKALFHYSCLFDMLDNIMPKDNHQRMLVEKVFGMEALNVIACEGPDRVERPETYKQWQMRHLDAGLRQVRFGGDLVDMVMQRVRKFYHRDFVIDEENCWLLMSWKGRIICALSCWQTARKA